MEQELGRLISSVMFAWNKLQQCGHSVYWGDQIDRRVRNLWGFMRDNNLAA